MEYVLLTKWQNEEWFIDTYFSGFESEKEAQKYAQQVLELVLLNRGNGSELMLTIAPISEFVTVSPEQCSFGRNTQPVQFDEFTAAFADQMLVYFQPVTNQVLR